MPPLKLPRLKLLNCPFGKPLLSPGLPKGAGPNMCGGGGPGAHSRGGPKRGLLGLFSGRKPKGGGGCDGGPCMGINCGLGCIMPGGSFGPGKGAK